MIQPSKYLINGSFTSFQDDDFELHITDTDYVLEFYGISKKILQEKTSTVYDDIIHRQGIYILEGSEKCYVGQSKNLHKRLSNHKYKDKVSFNRCFIMTRNTNLGAYLDYMEAYAYESMINKGYDLEQEALTTKTKTISKDDKGSAEKWINEFLSLLPILGFKKSPTSLSTRTSIPTPNNTSKIIKVKLNGNLINAKNSRKVFIKLLQMIGLELILNKCTSLFDSSFTLSKLYTEPKYRSYYELKENNEIYHLYLNPSKERLFQKITKIKETLKLNIEILD